MISTAVSVASFSVVLAETFAAVGLSTIVPNMFITAVRVLKAPGAMTDADKKKLVGAVESLGGMLPAKTPAGGEAGLVASQIGDLDVLIPKKATIDAEFEFQGKERYAGDVSGGGTVECVQVKAGYSALYESSSRNRITLHVEFATVHVTI
jgi:hypothetical protein